MEGIPRVIFSSIKGSRRDHCRQPLYIGPVPIWPTGPLRSKLLQVPRAVDLCSPHRSRRSSTPRGTASRLHCLGCRDGRFILALSRLTTDAKYFGEGCASGVCQQDLELHRSGQTPQLATSAPFPESAAFCTDSAGLRSTGGSACIVRVRGPALSSVAARCRGQRSDACCSQGSGLRDRDNRRSARQPARGDGCVGP
jgi:hypothetical protein